MYDDTAHLFLILQDISQYCEVYESRFIVTLCVTVFKIINHSWERVFAQRTSEQRISIFKYFNSKCEFLLSKFWRICTRCRMSKCSRKMIPSTVWFNSLKIIFNEIIFNENNFDFVFVVRLFGVYLEKKRDNCNNTVCKRSNYLRLL